MATSYQPKPKNVTMPCWTYSPWPHNLLQTASGKPASIQNSIEIDNMNNQNEIVENLFKLSTVQELKLFCEDLDPQDPFSAALHVKVEMWLRRTSSEGQMNFEPRNFLSADLSSIYYGLSPTIFMGSNQWALKRILNRDILAEKVLHFTNRAKYLSTNNRNKFCFIVVPEKRCNDGQNSRKISRGFGKSTTQFLASQIHARERKCGIRL